MNAKIGGMSEEVNQPAKSVFLSRGRLFEGRPSTPSDPNESLRRAGQGATTTDNRSGRLGNVGTPPTRRPWGPGPEWRRDAPVSFSEITIIIYFCEVSESRGKCYSAQVRPQILQLGRFI